MSKSFIIGRGSSIKLALPGPDASVEPVAATVTLTAAAAAGATSLSVSALPTGSRIPAGSFLQFVDSATGKEVVVQVTATALATATTLTVAAIPEAIPNGSTAAWPVLLRARETANISRQGNRVTSFTFDNDGYEDGLTATITNGITANGNYLPLDAGYRLAEYAFLEFKEVYAWLELPPPSAAYAKGMTYKGRASITSIPLDIPADNIVKANIEMAFNGKPVIVQPVPV
jgi:hypothetical protein